MVTAVNQDIHDGESKLPDPVKRRDKGSSIVRVLQIIEAIAQADRPLSPADLASLLDIPKPSVHRLLQQLDAESFVQPDIRGGWMAGRRLRGLSLSVLASDSCKTARQAILNDLAETIGETCGIAVPDGTRMLYFDRVQTNWPLQINLPVGTHTPIWCTSSGKLYLSTLPDAQRQHILDHLPLTKYARNTLTDSESLTRALQDIQQQGVGIDNEEFVDGMVACSVPILHRDGRMLASLFTHCPVIRKSLQDLTRFVPDLRRAAKALEEIFNQR
ncbi:Pca regulon regulatory protein [Thalassocella blandensis]|nr:Pca regulon regulatory protein [Thalassocella blandensis]